MELVKMHYVSWVVFWLECQPRCW